jgi:hypothetical protein
MFGGVTSLIFPGLEVKVTGIWTVSEGILKDILKFLRGKSF